MSIIFQKQLKKVYISGAMTGVEDYNRPAFKKAEERLSNMNFDVTNPHNLFTEEELHSILGDVSLSEDEKWGLFMKRDIEYLVKCDFIAVLPYWETSRGANLELAIAKAIKMPIVQADNLQEITMNINFSINKFQKL